MSAKLTPRPCATRLSSSAAARWQGKIAGLLGLTLAACSGPQLPASQLPAANSEASDNSEASEPALEVVRGRVLSDEGTIRVAVLDLKGKQALIQVTGVLSPINGKVLLHQLRDDLGGTIVKYATTYQGRPLNTIWELSRGQQLRWRLFYPGARSLENWLTVDAAATAALDTDGLVALHLEQQRRGELAELSRFDRQKALRLSKAHLAKREAELTQACGFALAATVDWQTVPDAAFLTSNDKDHWIGVFNNALTTLRGLCRFQVVRDYLQRFPKVQLAINEELGVREQDRVLLLELPLKPSPPLKTIEERLVQLEPAAGVTLKQQIAVERTEVCLGDRGQTVILGLPKSARPGLWYGRRGALHKVTDTRQNNVRPFAFFDYRFPGPHNFISEVFTDEKNGCCQLRCGEHSKVLKLADLQTVRRVLAEATYKPNPFQRQPHALARDRRGVYYYVDRAAGQGQKDFRVYIGPRGNCQRQQMKDIVSDSGGEIFTTQNGELRLIMSKERGLWIDRRGSRELQLLPYQENLALIFNQLGPYIGQPLGTPCDDF